jgi:uncharacterized integral membrane protein
MNKFKEFVNWLITTADNRLADTLTRILCIILVVATGVLVTVGSLVLFSWLIWAYPVILAVLLFVVLPSYLWVKFYKSESK